MSVPSDAVVLAGGEGSRLRPLTKYRPKPLLPVANRPVIEYVLEALEAAGVERVVVVVGYRGTRIQDYLSDGWGGLELDFIRQRSQLGSGHALLQAAGSVDEPFLVVNGDTVIDEQVIRRTGAHFFDAPGAAGAAAIARSPRPEQYGAVTVDDGCVTEVVEHPNEAVSYLVNAGVYVFNESVFAALASTDRRGGELYLTDALVNLPGPVVAADAKGVWLDPSTLPDLLSVTDQMLTMHRDLLNGMTKSDGYPDGVLVAESAACHESSVINSPAVVGPDCRIGPGAVVGGGACLGENVHVGANAVLDRSLIDSDTRVSAGAILRECVIGAGASIGAGVVAPGGAPETVDGDVDPDRRLGAVVADRAEVGANATLSAGALLGPQSAVAEGATVSRTVAEGAEVVR
ncbi:sugar phosphate nucleotidyltransferase [Candidatus Halobonum tyrrellensis]|uniref:Bifunctional protein GlmU n=1 Tax=Candidatus Halobonum tyrrellensis G22 TaxID=1324957 RepID=V4HA47_9EURY|nr:sugar phosphate nucleotidyltransferase [Candidatus Halobonum tyrrellensis]ESP86923.1 Nucleoside-diphosphate-sugar pyrophosphorylase family protein [Candidatus Halobonum tyrrellensis G22]